MAEYANSAWITPTIMSDRMDSNFYKKEDVENLNKIYESKIQVKSLIDIADNITDGPHDGYTFVDEGVLFIRSQNIKDAGFDLTDKKYITKEFHAKFKKSWLEVGDLLVTRIGEYYGNAAVVPPKYKGCNINHAIAKIKLKREYNPYYICAYINSPIGNKIYRRLGKSFTSPRVNLNDYNDFLIPIPSSEIQEYIGKKVKKAEELREEAKTLQKEIDILLEVDMLLKEETDKVYNIYDSKINWTNEINIEDRIDPNFYQKKYISTIEKLGNNKVRLEKYVRITKIRYQTGNINKYIEISSINNSFGTIDEVKELRPEEIPTSAKYQVKEGDILVSLVRPTRKAISIVTKEYDNAICTGGFAVLQSKGKVPVEFLTAVLRTNFVGIQFERYCAGSTYPTINEDDVVKVFIPMYSENQINKITENYRRIIDNIYTSKKLIEEAKQDVEDLIEGNFDMSKVKANS